MPAYVPPQKRNGYGADSAAADNKSSDDARQGGNAASVPASAQMSQDIRYCNDVRYSGDMNRVDKTGWFSRQDGRHLYQTRQDTLTELEVFGEPRAESDKGGGVDFDKYDKIPVQVTGEGHEDFKPIDSFVQASLNKALQWNLDRCGYKRPTPVQKYSIPIVTGGRDCMACAQTGSGKTCAFMVPCLESLLRSGPPPARRSTRGRPTPSPCALVMAPTRELAAQIHEESLKFSYDTGIQSRLIYGGADIREQVREMGKGTDILVATPGRLSDMIGREYVDLGLTQFLILDEADRMLDMGFEPQVREIVEQSGMGRHLDHRRQSMMFSATFPGGVQRMAGDFLADYLFITVGRVGSCSELIAQHLVYAEEGKGKTRALERMYREHAPPVGQLTVIFVDTKKKADEIEEDLWKSGLRVCAIHGDRSQSEREDALAAFKSGENPILVATDVAARGLDISNVGLVINYDMPKHMDDYVHRIGRTGRAGKRGVAIGFVNERVRYCTELAELLRGANQEVPQWLSQLAKENSANWGGKGKGGGKGNFGSTDVRETAKKAAAAAQAEEEAKKAAAAPKEAPRPPSPERVVPDAWDDSD
eukprot:gnl/TRDRNA2_/TRDRNA2_187356_c0_seq1.p1 gnl/TRDRNA2_/TRDRNA2_187356_c0~~gnl/TRDRNA2_/TRDRNA2_187356_c0_seq1.p1  ORF type:complete len:591 (+),score=100.50 gnl/TRDRNA2_/TRDRNA2_187356_c0_seq1:163-1935(+)